MASISSDRWQVAHSAMVWSATLAAVMLLGVVLAHWTWAWLAPPAQMRAPAATPEPRLETAFRLFGLAQQNQSAAAPSGHAIRLLGVVAARAERGYAVMQLEDGQILAVREGGDVTPGIRLAEVRADHVVLQRDGKRETLAWPQKGNRARN